MPEPSASDVPPRDAVLASAWRTFCDYDEKAKRLQSSFRQQVAWVLCLGVLITLLAIVNERIAGATDGRAARVKAGLRYVLIALPIVVALVTTVGQRFRHGPRWVVFRGAAEAVKREIFLYRARVKPYDDTAASQVLARRIADIVDELVASEGGYLAAVSSDAPDLPEWLAVGDDGLRPLDGAGYVRCRLAEQIEWHRRTCTSLNRQHATVLFLSVAIGAAGTLLAAADQSVWVAVTTAGATALASWLAVTQVESRLLAYARSFAGLSRLQSAWDAMPERERADPANVGALVTATEGLLRTEVAGWAAQTQKALARFADGAGGAGLTPIGRSQPGPNPPPDGALHGEAGGPNQGRPI